MSKSRRSCGVPGCDRPYQARGLCGTHWSRAMKGKKGDPKADEARNYLLPPTQRGKAQKPTASAVGPDAESSPIPTDVGKAVGFENEAALAAFCELTTALGLIRIKCPEGVAALRAGHERGVVMTPGGALRPCRFQVAGKADPPETETSETLIELNRVAEVLRLTTVKVDDGLYVGNPEAGRLVLITLSGRVLPAELRVEEAL